MMLFTQSEDNFMYIGKAESGLCKYEMEAVMKELEYLKLLGYYQLKKEDGRIIRFHFVCHTYNIQISNIMC